MAVSIVVYNSVTDAGFLDLSEEAELQRYRFRVKILHERLIGKLKQLNLQIQQINLFVVSVALNPDVTTPGCKVVGSMLDYCQSSARMLH